MDPARPLFGAKGSRADILGTLERLTEASPADILAVRLMIEPQAAAVAVSSATGADIQAITSAHETATAQTELAGFEHWDAEFHRLIYAATRNELLISLHDILGVIRGRRPWLRLKARVITDAKRRSYCTHHAAIAAAIAGRDSAGAAEAMHRHLVVVIDDLFPGRRPPNVWSGP